MRFLRELWERIWEEYSKLSWLGVLLIVICFIPDWQSRLAFWFAEARATLPHLSSPWGRFILLVLGLLVIWADHRRVLASRWRGHPRSLKARALKVREAMQKFMDGLGPEKRTFLDGESQEQFIVRTSTETGRRWNALGHFFELNCAAEVGLLFHEFGIRGVHDMRLYVERSDRMKEEEYREVIEGLGAVAETEQAKDKLKRRSLP